MSTDRCDAGMQVDGNINLANMLLFGKFLTIDVGFIASTSTTPQPKDAFQCLMAGAAEPKYPKESTGPDNKAKLHNQVISKLRHERAGFDHTTLASGKAYVETIHQCLWMVCILL